MYNYLIKNLKSKKSTRKGRQGVPGQTRAQMGINGLSGKQTRSVGRSNNHSLLGQKGFTLIEMLVSMAIFMAFTGILISSYTGIVRAQRDANEYREMYVQARQVMETMVQELRDGMVDYGNPGLLDGGGGLANGEMFIISRDSMKRTHICYDESLGLISFDATNLSTDIKQKNRGVRACGNPDFIVLNNPATVKVTKFRLYYSPKIDPYDPDKVDYSTSQFQPRVTIYAEFAKKLRSGGTYKMDLQTTVSSRVYSQVYPTNYLYTNDKFSQQLAE